MEGFVEAIAVAFGFIVTIAGIVGGWSAFRTQRNVQNAKLYQDSAKAWQTKANAQESEIADLREQNAQQGQQITQLQGQISVLQDMVTGKSAIEALTIEFRTKTDTILSELRAHRELLHSRTEDAQ